MNSKKREYFLLFLLIFLMFSINYKTLDAFVVEFFDESQRVVVSRIIDGDTVKAGNISIRLLGINSPERGERYYNEAREFLESLILNQTVKLEESGVDRYNRKLAYIFLESENVNLELIKNGFASPYFPDGKKKYYYEFGNAWEKCVGENLNFCEKSRDECADCVVLKDFDYSNERIVFYNDCKFDCDLTNWQIKDEGRKKFVFEDFILSWGKSVEVITGEGKNSEEVLFWRGEEYVWTRQGDTLFLRDDESKLVLSERY